MPSCQRLLVDEQWMIGRQEEHPVHKKPHSPNPVGSLLEQVEEGKRGTGWPTVQVVEVVDWKAKVKLGKLVAV